MKFEIEIKILRNHRLDDILFDRTWCRIPQLNEESRKIESAEKLRNIPLSWIEVGSGYGVTSYVRNY